MAVASRAEKSTPKARAVSRANPTPKAVRRAARATRARPARDTTRTAQAAVSHAAGPAGHAVIDWPENFDQLPYRIDPARLIELQRAYADKASQLWSGMMGGRAHAVHGDKRFSNAAWSGPHAYLADLYMLNAQFMTDLAQSVDADPKTRAKILFAVQQWTDAMSPANYLATNPEAQRKIVETQGESLAIGLANMMRDIQKGRISQTDETAFEVGRNVATTVGSVVFQNDLFQLIQYKPLGPTVFERPLLMVPPCINKFYILDLQPENSLVRHAVGQGQTVFLVSWRNPGEDEAALRWDDYIEQGVIKAIHVVRELASTKTINLLGFCIGGTLLATALSVLAARKQQPAESLTLLTTLLDFSDTGALDVFVDESQVSMREQSIGGLTSSGAPGGRVGLMPARDLATSFSFLRPNDLVWNYVVNNYLKGEAPAPFDLLYWNADSTSLPGPFFVWYLRNTYLENKLMVPGACKVSGVPVDLSRIKLPTYVYGSREDHIVPWPGAYASTQLLRGPKRFVLGASGHIAGVINPPEKGRRNYWAHGDTSGRCPADSAEWFASAEQIPGSWWPDWDRWLARFGGKKIKAPTKPGNTVYRPIEAAPGSYVRVRAV
jgi:polyhydroxyalkanoate synthase